MTAGRLARAVSRRQRDRLGQRVGHAIGIHRLPDARCRGDPAAGQDRHMAVSRGTSHRANALGEHADPIGAHRAEAHERDVVLPDERAEVLGGQVCSEVGDRPACLGQHLLQARQPDDVLLSRDPGQRLRYEDAVPVRHIAPHTPDEFELIIGQLLEKDPAKRIATALAVANRLKAMEYGLSLETRTDKHADHFSLATDEEYKLAGEPDDPRTVISRGETRFISPAEQELLHEPDSIAQHRNATVAMSGLIQPGPAPPAPNAPAEADAEGAMSTHFTTFDEAARKRPPRSPCRTRARRSG